MGALRPCRDAARTRQPQGVSRMAWFRGPYAMQWVLTCVERVAAAQHGQTADQIDDPPGVEGGSGCKAPGLRCPRYLHHHHASVSLNLTST